MAGWLFRKVVLEMRLIIVQGSLVNLVANVFLWILLLKTMYFLEWNSFRKYAKDEESKAFYSGPELHSVLFVLKPRFILGI